MVLCKIYKSLRSKNTASFDICKQSDEEAWVQDSAQAQELLPQRPFKRCHSVRRLGYDTSIGTLSFVGHNFLEVNWENFHHQISQISKLQMRLSPDATYRPSSVFLTTTLSREDLQQEYVCNLP